MALMSMFRGLEGLLRLVGISGRKSGGINGPGADGAVAGIAAGAPPPACCDRVETVQPGSFSSSQTGPWSGAAQISWQPRTLAEDLGLVLGCVSTTRLRHNHNQSATAIVVATTPNRPGSPASASGVIDLSTGQRGRAC